MRQVSASANSRRALYDYLVTKYPGFTITDSYLLTQQSLQATPTSIQFPVLTNQSPAASVIEKRLDITDRFCAFDWSVMMRKVGTSASSVTDAQMALSVPLTYPNPAVFTGASEAVNLEAIYNGSLKVTIDSEVYYQNYPVRNFYRVPVSQLGTTSAAISGPVQYKIAADGWDTMNFGFATITPNFEFSGIGKNEIVLSIPTPTTMIGTSSSNFIEVVIRGFLIQNINQTR